MAKNDQESSTRPARDGFERYYAEKIWEWIPGIYKHEDSLAAEPGVPLGGSRGEQHVLRSIVEVLARQAAVARRSIDRLWEDQLIDFCDDWAVPYIGDLVGTRLVHELNRRGRRVDVARTLFYRRRKGTPAVLAALVRDITGWEGVVVESFRRLGRLRHGLDPLIRAGTVTFTPPGGTADLRRTRGGDLVDGPFDGYFHTPDVRQLRGFKGRYNIPKVNVHLYRLLPFAVILATPADFGQRRFTFDPSGRDIPLFRPDQRPEAPECRPVKEWEIPAPIPCRLLDAAAVHLIPEAVALLVGESSGGTPFPHQEVLAGTLEDWGASLTPPAEVEAVIDPERGRFLLLDEPGAERVFVPVYHYGLPGPIGAGTYEHRGSVAVEEATDLPDGGDEPGPVTGFSISGNGVYQLVNSKTYMPDPPAGNVVAGVDKLCLQAADGERPYLKLVPEADGHEWTFEALAKPTTDPEAEENQRLLTLEGLWVGIVPADLVAQSPPPGERCAPVATTLILDGHFDRVVIRHSTLDPGGEQARLEHDGCMPIPSVNIEVREQVEELIIESSIVGSICESTSEADPCSVGRLVIRDSIVHSLDPGTSAITTKVAEVHLERVTVFGDVEVNRLWASEALIQGVVRVTDNQHGCFRFSAAASGDSRLPPQYESHLVAGGIANHFFVSRRFGDPGYAQLSETAPREIVRGAENGSEIGAWSALLSPIKLADLAAKVDEYLPFGLIAQYIFET